MKVFLYPYSSKIEALVAGGLASVGLIIEPPCSVEFLRSNLLRPNAATLLLLNAEIEQDLRATLYNGLVDSRNANASSVIVFGTDHTVEAIAGAFASGADDYICLPCRSSEVEARIRAAVRRLRHFELSLEKTVSSNPPLQRPSGSVLGTAQRQAKTSRLPSHEAPLLDRISGNSLSEQFLSISTLRNIRSITLKGLSFLEVDGLEEVDCISFKESDVLCGAWAALLLPSRNLWLDIVVETNQESAELLYNHLTPQRPVATLDPSTSLMQVVMTLKERIQNSFKEAGDDVIIPDFTQRLPAVELGGLSDFVVDRVRVAIESNQFQMCISYFVFERRSVFRAVEDISLQSIADELIPLSGSKYPLLQRGVMLNRPKLKSLRKHFANVSPNFGIKVFEASGVAAAIQNSRAVS